MYEIFLYLLGIIDWYFSNPLLGLIALFTTLAIINGAWIVIDQWVYEARVRRANREIAQWYAKTQHPSAQ